MCCLQSYDQDKLLTLERQSNAKIIPFGIMLIIGSKKSKSTHWKSRLSLHTQNIKDE